MRHPPGKARQITPQAQAWLISLACQKVKDLGYPYELWTVRLLARHVPEHAVAAGHPCLSNLAPGTVCKILDHHAVKPHKLRVLPGTARPGIRGQNGRRALRLS